MTALLLLVVLVVAGLVLLAAGGWLEARRLRACRTWATGRPEDGVIDAVLAPAPAGAGDELWVCPAAQVTGGGHRA